MTDQCDSLTMINDLFRPIVGGGTANFATSYVLIACRVAEDTSESYADNPIMLVTWDVNLALESRVCQCLARLIQAEEITRIPGYDMYIHGTSLLRDSQYIIIFNEPFHYFRPRYIDSIGEFYQYIQFADRYLLNVPYICSKPDNIVWLLLLRERTRDIWDANSAFLTNIEQKIFNILKFEQPIAQGTQLPAYPNATAPAVTPKFTPIRQIAAQPLLSAEEFSSLLALLLDNGAKKFARKLIAMLGSSIEYYDMMLYRPTIEQARDLPVFNPTIFYALRIMFLEEVSAYVCRRAPGDSRFIVDIDTASSLPHNDNPFSSNPYMCTLVTPMNSNGLTLPAHLKGERGIYSLEEFRARLSIFTENILQYIPWSSSRHKTALSGSAITACAIRNPLQLICKDIERYFAEYYPAREKARVARSSDPYQPREAVFSYTDDIGDCDLDEELYNSIAEAPAATPTQVADDGVIHHIEYSDIDIMIACKWEEFDDIATSHYEAIKKAIKELKIPMIGDLRLERKLTENKHKYIISGLARECDIFHVDDILSVIIKYHLGCVRAWYDGSTVHCFPSFISAAMTGMNADIRWTSNRKDVRDIVLKYHSRGFGTLLTQKDRQSLIQYVNGGAQWSHITPPAGNGHNWRHNRDLRNFWRMPLFHNRVAETFNPSFHRIGIHANLKAKPQKLSPWGLIQFPPSRWYTVTRGIHPASRGDHKTIVVPFLCDKLVEYM
jgi:hypothetical protein